MAKRISSTNYDSEVKNIINKIIPACTNIYIRVGYFYFSGFSLIAKALVNKNIKVLVGMNADKRIHDIVKSKKKRRQDYFEDLVKNVDESHVLDRLEEQDAYSIFEKKLSNGTLEIRQSNEPDHAKEYIFELDRKHASVFQRPGMYLSGSQNLTASGFFTNKEVAHLHDEEPNFNAAKSDFLNFWDPKNSIPLINKEYVEEFQKYSKKFHFKQNPTPHLMFVRVLDEYFKDRDENNIKYPREITNDDYADYKYQKDAIAKGIDIVKKHNGVLLSDVVGLGKSIVASAIAYNLKLETFVISPPHLKQQWKDYLRQFKVKREIFTTGKLDDALKAADQFTDQKLIIVDEVHKFRNDETADYLKLYQLCHGGVSGKPNKVVLLSATPFNNIPKDTFSLIKLFQIPTRSTLLTITNLSELFDHLTKKYNAFKREQDEGKREKVEIDKDFKVLGEQIREIITPLMIRRSRIDLKKIKTYWQDLQQQNVDIPDVADPILLEYELNELKTIYIDTLNLISPSSKENKYKCSRYKPIAYVKPEFIEEILEKGGYDQEDGKRALPKTQQNIADFMKRLMVRRFESSTSSFYKTLSKIISSTKKIINFYEKAGFVPVYRKGELPDYEEIFDLGTDDDTDANIDEMENINIDEIEKLPKMKEFLDKGMWLIKKNQLKATYIIDVKKDLKVLEEIKNNWEIINKKNFVDPKIAAFKKIILEQIKKEPKRKIIIFSEFADTVHYLFDSMKGEFKVFKYTSKMASNQKIKDKIMENFDASSKKKENEFNILIATDAISEGFNLHRAGTIFNFDIPYNPTRVVQRFGRINRITKKMFDTLYIYNFFPTEIGEKEVNMRRITELKKTMFNSIFGDDTKVLTKYEDLQSHFIKAFDDLYKETESPESYFENIIYDLRDYNRPKIMEAANIAKRVKSKRKIRDKNGLIVFSKKGDTPRFVFMEKDEKVKNIDHIEAFKLFEANENEKYIPFDKKYEPAYEKVKSKLFEENPISPPNKKKKKIIEKLEKLSVTSKYSDYVLDMYKVVKDLDALTPFQLRLISTTGDFDKNIKEIEKRIPRKLLKALLNTYDGIQSKKDALIITEQLND